MSISLPDVVRKGMGVRCGEMFWRIVGQSCMAFDIPVGLVTPPCKPLEDDVTEKMS